jgi:ubiquinol-cytochrome c reductase cytochrome b subunit
LIAALLVFHLGIIWRQMHTNYPGPGRTDRSIVGSRLWPSYAAKSVGLFFFVFSAVAILGGLVQIDPVWIYGPYNPVAVIPGAQPDWYLGWVEGAMRLFPAVNLHIGRWLIPEVFFPAILMPTLLFAALYAYPFLEKHFSRGEDREHNVLRLPYRHPFNTAFGSAILMFLLVLIVAGGDDVVAVATGSSVVMIRSVLRVLVFVAPAITAAVVYVWCAEKRRRATSQPAATPENAPAQALEQEQ